MPNTIKRVRPPVGWTAQDLIDLLGANCRIHVQRASTELGTFADIATPTKVLVAGTESYDMPDPTGLSSSWYKVWFEDSAGNNRTDAVIRPADYA
jgi:hypothetical protein